MVRAGAFTRHVPHLQEQRCRVPAASEIPPALTDSLTERQLENAMETRRRYLIPPSQRAIDTAQRCIVCLPASQVRASYDLPPLAPSRSRRSFYSHHGFRFFTERTGGTTTRGSHSSEGGVGFLFFLFLKRKPCVPCGPVAADHWVVPSDRRYHTSLHRQKGF